MTPVLRGSVFPAPARQLTPRAADAFGFAQIPDIELLYHTELTGMVDVPVSFDQVQTTLPELVRVIHTAMNDEDRHFLLALKRGDQQWRDFALPEVERLPAIQWKLYNLTRMQPVKRRQAVNKLEAILFG